MAFWAKWLNFSTYWAFSPARMVEIENGLLRCDQHLELQVLSTHMPYIEEIFFRTSNRAYSYQNSSNCKPKRPKIWFLGPDSIIIYINTYFFIRNKLKKENSVFSSRPNIYGFVTLIFGSLYMPKMGRDLVWLIGT